MPITDKDFYDYAQEHQGDGQLENVERFIRSQNELYLRIGLTRKHQVEDGRNGYWMQVNGIYTFPKFHEKIRNIRNA